MAEVVGLVLYFRWSVEGPRFDRLVLFEYSIRVWSCGWRRSRKSAPVVKDLFLAPSCVSSGCKSLFCKPSVVTLDWSRLVSSHQFDDFYKSTDVSRDEDWQWFGLVFLIFLLYFSSFVFSIYRSQFSCSYLFFACFLYLAIVEIIRKNVF